MNEQSSGSKFSPHAAEDAVASNLAMEIPVTTRQRPTTLFRRFRSVQIVFFLFTNTLSVQQQDVKQMSVQQF